MNAQSAISSSCVKYCGVTYLSHLHIVSHPASDTPLVEVDGDH